MKENLLIPFETSTEEKRTAKKRANSLSGAEWVKHSMSVWGDIRKSPQENSFKHPAMFPEMLVKRLLSCYCNDDDKIVLDPFMGSGSTIVAAYKLGKLGLGLDISEEYIELAKRRIEQIEIPLTETNIEHVKPKFIVGDARRIQELIDHEIDICVTSPPYWNILNQKRTADGKEIRNYGDDVSDLGNIEDYEKFLLELNHVWKGVFNLLKPGGYLIINVMDIRKKNRFYSYHSDLIKKLTSLNYPAFDLDDIIIWNRQSEYNNLRPLGYPYKFRINKIHEYLLIFEKPKSIKSFVKKWQGG